MHLFHVVSAALAERSLIHLFGAVFHPVFVVMGTVLAAIYGLTASYGFAIVVLTIVIMAFLLPLTISSTRSAIAMQRMQPKIRHLQQTYKGREDRERLNQEMMRLYKEEGVNPAGSCLPLLVQLPILIVLYDVIRGLNTTFVTVVRGHPVTAALPRYIPNSSRMYHNLVAGHGAMNWLGINLARSPFSAHAQWFGILPYVALIVVATGLQYVQLAQVRRRNPVAAEANSQVERVERVLPVFYAFIYFVIPGAVILYTIVATSIRIATQRLIFRRGVASSGP
jgi:YidC/Oxa1 family membrane protein insertase